MLVWCAGACVTVCSCLSFGMTLLHYFYHMSDDNFKLILSENLVFINCICMPFLNCGTVVKDGISFFCLMLNMLTKIRS
jgi:hypothetical protein